MDTQLEVYFDSTCPTSKVTLELITSVRNQPLGLSIEVVDLYSPNSQLPETVVALPTFILNGEPIFLGNPTIQNLIDRLIAPENGVAKPDRSAGEANEDSKTGFPIYH